MQSAAAAALMPSLIFFAAYTTTVTGNTFQLAGQPPKLPLPLGDLDPI